MILSMIREGEGISWLPRYVIQEELKKEHVSVVNYQFAEVHMYRQLFRRKDKWVSNSMRAWIELSEPLYSLSGKSYVQNEAVKNYQRNKQLPVYSPDFFT